LPVFGSCAAPGRNRTISPRLLRQAAKGQNTSTSTFCESALDATKEAIRKNWAYLRGINLNATDLVTLLSIRRISRDQFSSERVWRARTFGAPISSPQGFEGTTGWSTADFTCANVTELLTVNIRQFSLDHGAQQMTDSKWQAWRSCWVNRY
jgi:hypothetical protein